MLEDLAETVKVSAELSMEPSPIPYLDLHKDREAVLAATQALLAVEKADEKELKRLVAPPKDFKDTNLSELLLGIMPSDKPKHRSILSFIRDHPQRTHRPYRHPHPHP